MMAGDGPDTPQHMLALGRGNEIRLARATLKRDVYQGEVQVSDLLAPGSALPEFLVGMRISELLRAQRRWGATRVRKFLEPLAIHEMRLLGDLTARQRARIVDALNKRRRHDDRLLKA